MPRFSPPARFFATKNIRKDLVRNQRYLRTWANRVGIAGQSLSKPADSLAITTPTTFTSDPYPDPNTDVYVTMIWTAQITAPNSSARTVSIKPGISLNNGATWTDGPTLTQSVDAVTEAVLNVSFTHEGSATSSLLSRIVVDLASGPNDFDVTNQSIVMIVTPQ